MKIAYSILEEHLKVCSQTRKVLEAKLEALFLGIQEGLSASRMMIFFGNGGSAADAQHFAAEMIGKLTRHRDPIPAIALTTDTSIITAVANDYSINDIFWRQVHALGQPGDVLVALSTSGNSKNVVKAVNTAKEKQMQTIALLGKGGGDLAAMVDVALVVPSQISQRIQEAHIAVIHTWCELIEDVLHPKQE